MLMPWYIPKAFHAQTRVENQKLRPLRRLVHLPDQIVDLVFPVAQVTTFDEMLELPLTEAAGRAVELERPQEI
jgi:hypothetical protein